MEDQSKRSKDQDVLSTSLTDNKVSSSENQPLTNQGAQSSSALDVEQLSKIANELGKNSPSGDIYLLVNNIISESILGKGNHQSTIKQESSSLTSSKIENSTSPSTSINKTDIAADVDPQQQINLNIQTIKELLEDKDLEQAVTQSKELTLIKTNNIKENCDVTVSQVINIASRFAKHKRHLRSLSLIRWVLELIDNIETPRMKLKKINDCLDIVDDNMVDMKGAGDETDIQQRCLPLFERLLEQAKLVQIDDVLYKAEVEARCMYDIGVCYCYIDKDNKADEVYQEAIRRMESEVGEEEATKYEVVAHGYHNRGMANENMGNYKEAEKFYEKSIELWKGLENISEENREIWIAHVEENLKIVKSKIK